MNINLYTDGSSKGNPGPSGCSFVVVDSNQSIIHKEFFAGGITTNNRMEMYGIILGISWIKKNLPSIKKINIYTDSNLIVNTINHNWKKNKNRDLWEILLNQLETIETKFTWVKGHSTNKFNNLCDELANHAAQVSIKSKLKYDQTANENLFSDLPKI